MRYITPKQAAAQEGVALCTIYRRARRGALTTIRENGRIMVKVETVSETKPDPAAGAQGAVQPEPAKPTQHSGGGQRELMPREGGRIAFFQGMTWL